MANKKTTRKPSPKLKKTAARPAKKKIVAQKAKVKKSPAPKKVVRKKVAPRKKTLAPKKSAPKKPVVAKKVASKKSPSKKVHSPGKARNLDSAGIERNLLRGRAEIQSGDLQGLSRKARAASESVDELLEEGNAFEAGIVQGIERADESDEDEVVSHESPADDVPGEYLDED